MIPKEFDYVAPTSVADALAALRDGGDDAKVLAGGHSLIPMMKLRLAAPTRLVDLRKITELSSVFTDHAGHTMIGPMVTYRSLMGMGDKNQLLAECAASVGDEQVRARGTIGGSLAHADPAADLPAAALALDATLVAAHMNGGMSGREIPARDFFLELFTTALEPGEIITGVRIPSVSGRTGSAYVKIRNKASHYALVGAAVMLAIEGDGSCSNAAIAITGAASRVFRLESAENALKGTRLSKDDIQNAANMAGQSEVEWMSDLFGSADYRKHLAGIVTARALDAAKSRL